MLKHSAVEHTSLLKLEINDITMMALVQLLKNIPVSLHVKAGKITLKTDENGRVRVKALGHNGEEYRTVDLSLSKPAGVTPGLQDKALIYTVIAIES